jgi:hypothetical protein
VDPVIFFSDVQPVEQLVHDMEKVKLVKPSTVALVGGERGSEIERAVDFNAFAWVLSLVREF